MRLTVALMLIATAVPSAWADDKADRERKVRVALALAAPDHAACGKCRTDVEQARKEAVAEQRPLVLFVGEACGGLGCAAEKVGGIAVKVAEYTSDDRPPAEPRVVVLEPKADKSGLYISDVLPARVGERRLAEAVVKAKPAVNGKAKLNWEF